VTGSGFTGDASTTILKINGVEQESTSVSSTEAIFTLTDIPQSNITGLAKIYFDIGLPKNHNVLTSAVLVLEPKLVSVSPSSGSIAGSIIYANIQGAGPLDTDINLKVEDGVILCEATEVVSSGLLKCETTAAAVPAASTIQILKGTSLLDCANQDTTQCQYEQ